MSTIEEGLTRAKEILAAGKPLADELAGVRGAVIVSLASGTISGTDIHDAYTLLERFVGHIEQDWGYDQLRADAVAEIERLRAEMAATQRELRDTEAVLRQVVDEPLLGDTLAGRVVAEIERLRSKLEEC
jgi:hypothetical protein